MPSLLACFGCGGKGESDDIRVLDYRHGGLTDVPSDVFASERTLEELLLDSNQLNELPRQLFYCHGLRELGLSDNELTSLPPAVASLINLQSLDLSKNAISDIPDNIKGCKQLSVVDASINPLCRLPEGFTQLLSLHELYLNDTFLEYLPANFGRLSRLRILELRENQLNTLPKSIARLTNLQRLDIGQNDFSELPEVIGSLSNLTELWFDNNKVKSLPPLMGRLKKLVHVDASKNKVDWVAGELEHCVQLTDLHLSSNNLKDLPEKLGGCRQLQVLRLDDNAITHLPESIGGLAALEELVVTQNDVEALPASVGLLRNLHTLHVDDNLLTELPPELGSCTRLTVLTAASNRLTSVPAELGHLPRLAVLNLCDNLIPHLPVSLTKLKLRALWLSENQNKPQVQLQSETLPETGQRVLTCFMLPQQPRSHQPETVVEADTFPGQGWDEQRRAKTMIKFAFDGDVDKPGRLTRAPTPYPKELKALAKHARNLNSLQKDPSRQFVLGRSQDTNKTSTSTVVSPTKDETDSDSGRRGSDSAVKQPLLEKTSLANHDLDDTLEAEENSLPLKVIEPRQEERPLLREARNVRNSQTSVGLGMGIIGENGLGPSPANGNATSPQGPEMPYAIGDRKVFGQAQVVATNQSRDKMSTKPSVAEDSPVSPPAPVSAELATPSSVSSAAEGDSTGDVHDKRIKKPPPYHIAAVMSRRAADFQEATVEVSSTTTGAQGSTGLTVKDLPGQDVKSAVIVGGGGGGVPPPSTTTEEDETNDTSSSSDSGYGNGKTSSQQTADEHLASDNSGATSPSSPQNFSDPHMATVPSTPSSPLTPSYSSISSTKSFMANISASPKKLSNPAPLLPPSDHLNHPTRQQTSSFVSSSPQLLSTSPPMTQNLSNEIKSSTYTTASSSGTRPASIATGSQFESHNHSGVQRPGSLALGTLADSALLNRLPRDQRPGSLAAPINTLGIPPAPTRAMSYMGLNVTSPTRSRDPAMFRSQDLSRMGRGLTPAPQVLGGTASSRQESNGLVSIIDQVTTSLLEHSESPPPKTPGTPESSFPVTSSSGMVASESDDLKAPVSQSKAPVSLPEMVTTSSHYTNSASESVRSFAPYSSSSNSSSISAVGTSISSSSMGGARGPTNFTQDQPRGEVLHPTPHRPHILSPTSQHSSETVQSPVNHTESHSHNNDTFSPVLHPDTPTTQHSKAALPKPLTRIPSLNSDCHIPHSNVKSDHAQSPHSVPLIDSRIPSLTNNSRSPSSLSKDSPKMAADSRIPSTAIIGKIPGHISSDPKESRITSPGSIGHAKSGLANDRQLQGESRIPSLSSSGRSPSSLSYDSPTVTDGRKPQLSNMGRSPSNLTSETVNQTESRIPALSAMGRTKSNLARESLPNSSRIPGPGSQDPAKNLPTLNPSHSSTGVMGKTVSGIPSLSSQGRSSGNLYSNIPSPASAGMQNAKQHSADVRKPLSYGSPSQSQIALSSRLQSPSSSSGIRPPGTSPTGQYSSSNSAHSMTYSTGIRPPTLNVAINTPGIPLPSSGSNLMNPGSRGSVSSTGSGSRIPMAGGGVASRLPAPSMSKHRVSPTTTPTPECKGGNSAWMFGQHKNARVFPVVIEKNPGLGFTIGQSDADPEDKSIYVTSVAGGGAASSALKVGDKILQVDGSDLRSSDLHTATSILNKTSNTVNFMVSRLQ